MLDELHVENIALIEDASIEFAPGLTVLTGETGAGKTAMLSALALMRGARADSAVVREGSEQAVVEARLAGADGEHVLRRQLTAKGRSKCNVDGQMATVGELAEHAAHIRIHGQNENSKLVDPSVQLAYLDAWIDASGAHLQGYRGALAAYRAAAAELSAFEKAKGTAARELEFMRYTIEQIDAVKPHAGEVEDLEEELPRLQHAEQLAVAVNEAVSLLHADGAALDQLAQASRSLEREVGIDDELDAIAERLADAQAELSDLARDLNSYHSMLTFDPERLEEVLGRLDELNRLMQRFGPTMDDVLSARDEAKAALEAHAESPEREKALRENLEQAQAAVRESADELSTLRQQRAREFCALLAESVSELAMNGASFEFSFSRQPLEAWTEEGPDRVEFMYSPSAASSMRPLARIASGGELSRISLAIECLHYEAIGGQADETFVFDEIDQGVGGATGAAVARRLSELSRNAQVIVVTHLPQVAALADVHYVIEKHEVAGALPHTDVHAVSGDERIGEVARMLAGTVDATALEHARSLLGAS